MHSLCRGIGEKPNIYIKNQKSRIFRRLFWYIIPHFQTVISGTNKPIRSAVPPCSAADFIGLKNKKAA